MSSSRSSVIRTIINSLSLLPSLLLEGCNDAIFPPPSKAIEEEMEDKYIASHLSSLRCSILKASPSLLAVTATAPAFDRALENVVQAAEKAGALVRGKGCHGDGKGESGEVGALALCTAMLLPLRLLRALLLSKAPHLIPLLVPTVAASAAKAKADAKGKGEGGGKGGKSAGKGKGKAAKATKPKAKPKGKKKADEMAGGKGGKKRARESENASINTGEKRR